MNKRQSARTRASFIPISGLAAVATLAVAATAASAGSIQQPGLTTGLAEGYAPEPGLYGVLATSFGGGYQFNTAMAVPAFLNWSTPIEAGPARLEIKAAPLVLANVNMPGLHRGGVYSSYVSAWTSFSLGHGFNIAIGEGAWLPVVSYLPQKLGADYAAFQQNFAVTYLRDNWHVTANGFYTTGHTGLMASAPSTMNVDFTLAKRDGRAEYGLIGYGQWDLNKPVTGYGERQRQVAAGLMAGYLIANQVIGQIKVTHAFYAKNAGHETRVALQAIVPLYSAAAPVPFNSSEALEAR